MQLAHPILGLSLLLIGCEDISEATEPPEILDAELACIGNEAIAQVVVGARSPVTNLRIEGAESSWFPIEESPNLWRSQEPMDCDAEWELRVLATNVLGLQASTSLRWPALELDSSELHPPHGSTLGGTEVTLHGRAMDTVTAVWFGDTPTPIQSATADAVVVTSPPGSAGPVEVRLEAGDDRLVLPSRFTYWADQTGKIELLTRTVTQVYDTRWFTVGSAYATLDPYGPFVQHEVVVHEPIDPSQAYPVIYPEAGDCSTDATAGWAALDAGSYVGMGNAELGPLALLSTGGGSPVYYYVESDVDPTLWDGQLFDLELVAETAYTPAMVVEAAAMVPRAPTTTSFDWQSNDPTVWGEDLRLSWSSTSAQRLSWTAYPAEGTTVLGSSSCMADASTGELTIPWESLVAGVDPSRVTALYLQLSFIEDEQIPLVHDNSAVWAIGEFNYWLRLEVSTP